MMKKLLFATLLPVLALASCKRNQVEVAGVPVKLEIGIRHSAVSKATEAGTPEENAVSSLQVSVFKDIVPTPLFESSAGASASSLNLTVTSGSKIVTAIVNEYAPLTSITSYSQLLGTTTYLKDNALGKFIMAGSVPASVSGSNSSLAVPVDRITSRIKVGKITNKLRNGYASKDVSLRRVFLTGAASSTDYAMKAAPGGLYATSGINSLLDLNSEAVTGAEKSAVNALIYKDILSPVIAADASWDGPLSLYTYPNPASARATHIVAEMVIDGMYFTYPVELPALVGNHSFEISELVLLSLGNPSNGDDVIDPGEDDPVSSVEASFSVSVKDWEIIPVSNGEDGKYTI